MYRGVGRKERVRKLKYYEGPSNFLLYAQTKLIYERAKNNLLKDEMGCGLGKKGRNACYSISGNGQSNIGWGTRKKDILLI